MALRIGELYGLLTLRSQDFVRGLRSAKRNMMGMKQDWDNALESLHSRAAWAGVGIAAAFGYAAYAGVKANSDTQQFLATMTRLTGSTKQAKEELAKLKKFAIETPFEMEDLKKGELIMRAVGLETDRWRQTIGDTAAAWKSAGKSYEDVVQAIADAQTGELERLKEFGITKQQIIDHGNKIMRGKELVNNQGQITDVKAFNTVLLDLMKKRYGGMMKVQSATFAGLLSNIEDFAKQSLEVLSKPLFKKLEAGAKSAAKALDEFQKSGQIDVWAEKVNKRLNETIGFLSRIDWALVGNVTKFTLAAGSVVLFASSLAKLGRIVGGMFASLGPAGWLVAGLSLLAGSYALSSRKTEELSLAKIRLIENQQKELEQTSGLIDRYESLRNQSGLTTDELLRYMDILTLLGDKQSLSKDQIRLLKDEQAQLQQKSGLTNSELSEMVGLNNELIKTLPGATTKISEQGNVVATSTGKLRDLNAEKRENLRLELEVQKRELQSAMPEIYAKKKRAQKEYNDISNEIVSIQDKHQAKESEIAALKERMKGLSEDERVSEEIQLQHLQSQSQALSGKLSKMYEAQGALKKEIDGYNQQEKQLARIREQLAQIELAKIGNGQYDLKSVEDATKLMEKNNGQIKQLEEMKGKRGANVKMINEEIERLKTENDEIKIALKRVSELGGKFANVKGKIDDLVKTTNYWNSALGKSITKSVNVQIRSSGNLAQTPVVVHGPKGKRVLHRGGTVPEARQLPGSGDIRATLRGGETVMTKRTTSDVVKMLSQLKSLGISPNGGLRTPEGHIFHLHGLNDPMAAADATIRRLRAEEWLNGG